MKGNDLRDVVLTKGPEATYNTLMECLDEGKLNPSDFGLREVWEAFVGPCGKTLAFARRKAGYVELMEAAVDSSIYQSIAGRIVSDSVIEGYNRVSSIGDMLVTTRQTKERYEKDTGWSPTEGVKTVIEGENYEQSGIGHKFVGTGELFKKGRILAITEEAVVFDRTGMILGQAQELGEDARMDKERTILRAFLGIDTAYFPSDTPTALYSALPQLIAGNPLNDWTNIEAAELALADTQDEEGNTIVLTPDTLVVPTALKRTGQRIVSAIEITHKNTDGTAGTTAQARETVSANPVKNDYAILSSPLIHQLLIASGVSAAVATSSWWIGQPKRQFVWREVWPIQTQKAARGSEAEFNADVVAQFKVRFYGGIYAKDNVYVARNNSAP
jgi:hypothetical protein